MAEEGSAVGGGLSGGGVGGGRYPSPRGRFPSPRHGRTPSAGLREGVSEIEYSRAGRAASLGQREGGRERSRDRASRAASVGLRGERGQRAIGTLERGGRTPSVGKDPVVPRLHVDGHSAGGGVEGWVDLEQLPRLDADPQLEQEQLLTPRSRSRTRF